MLDGHFNMYLSQKPEAKTMWVRFFESWDDVDLAMKGVLRYVHNETKPPMIADIRQTIKAIQTARAAATPKVEQRWSQDEFPAWVKTWAVARFKHGDTRTLPQQKQGYDQLQRDNPKDRAYVWPDQEPMPPEDQQKYAAEGKDLKPEQVAALIQQVGR